MRMPENEMAAAIALREACGKRADVMERGRSEGTAYVWGRQDERGTCDTGPSLEFGKVWGAVLALYSTEALSGHGTLQSAYLEWAATGSVLVTVATWGQRGVFAVFCPDEFGMPSIAPVPWAESDWVPSYRYTEPAQRFVRDVAFASV